MKIEKFVAVVNAVATTAKGAGREKAAVRETRMRAFFALPENATLWQVGQFLANKEQDKTLAEWVIAGEPIELPEITINGRVLPMVDGFTISLATLNRDTWGCPVCGSAHGSGVTPSPDKNANLLMASEFYYNPATKRMFTISEWCFDKWVKGLGFASKERFIPVPKAEIPKPQPIAPPNKVKA